MVKSIPSKHKIFLCIPSKPELFLRNIHEYTILSIHARPETSTSWLLSSGSLQLSMTHFYKYIRYYVIDQTTNNNILEIRKQTL